MGLVFGGKQGGGKKKRDEMGGPEMTGRREDFGPPRGQETGESGGINRGRR